MKYLDGRQGSSAAGWDISRGKPRKKDNHKKKIIHSRAKFGKKATQLKRNSFGNKKLLNHEEKPLHYSN